MAYSTIFEIFIYSIQIANYKNTLQTYRKYVDVWHVPQKYPDKNIKIFSYFIATI
jgi:hypothetical protein